MDGGAIDRVRAGDAPSAVVGENLRAAVAEIDSVFGAGYAADHPELVAAMIQAASLEAIVDAGRVASQGGEATARDCVRELSQTLLQLKPRIFR